MAKKKQPDTFARRLREYRETAGLSIYALAAKARLSRSYLGQLEAGTREPSLEVARKIADALGKRLDCWQD